MAILFQVIDNGFSIETVCLLQKKMPFIALWKWHVGALDLRIHSFHHIVYIYAAINVYLEPTSLKSSPLFAPSTTMTKVLPQGLR